MTAPSTSAHVTPGRIAANTVCCASTACSNIHFTRSLAGPITIPRSSSALYPHTGAPVSETSRSPGWNAMSCAIAWAHELRRPIWPR